MKVLFDGFYVFSQIYFNFVWKSFLRLKKKSKLFTVLKPTQEDWFSKLRFWDIGCEGTRQNFSVTLG